MRHLTRTHMCIMCSLLISLHIACTDDDTPKKDMSTQQDMSNNADMITDIQEDLPINMMDMPADMNAPPCEQDQNVVSNQCMTCPAGTTNEAGDDPSGEDTTCDPTLCMANEYVKTNACEPCPAGTTNAADDDASGADTMCDATLCQQDEYVKTNACEPCPAGTTNAADDDASGADTICDDACVAVFGVSCDMLKQNYIKASNSDSSDFFGQTIAASGDTLVVTSNGEDSNSSSDPSNNALNNSGAVYVFINNNGTWSQEAYIKASNADASDAFGASVAIDGDTLVVGATLENGNATGVNGDESNNSTKGAGAAYVFKRANGAWTQEAYLKASNPGIDDNFGLSVAISGDTVVVGAPFEDSDAPGVDGDGANNGKSSSGAAYVFARSNGTWSHQAYLKASNPDVEDRFGYSVAIENDTIAVGAYGEQSAATTAAGDQSDNTADKRGAVYIFSKTNNTWAQQTYLKPSTVTSWFGWSLAMDGDTLAVGARYDAPGGAVFVFNNSNNTWTEQAKLKATPPGSEDDFGISIALHGDILVAGAYREDSNATTPGGDPTDDSAQDSGAAYVFKRTNGTWSNHAYLKAPNAEPFDIFGFSVGVMGNTVIVGAYSEQSNAAGINGDQSNNDSPATGAVYAFAP